MSTVQYPAQYGQASPRPVAVTRAKRQMIERAKPLLPPGAEVRQIFLAGTKGVGLFILLAVLLAIVPGALLFALLNQNRLIAITDDAIYVLDCGHGAKPKRVLVTLPRATRLGQGTGGIANKIQVGSETLWVGQKFRAELATADADITQRSAVGSEPMSDDGAFWWDGRGWIACAAAAPPSAPRSPDGAYWWDGAQWREIPKSIATHS
jgi:hypothetical protein